MTTNTLTIDGKPIPDSPGWHRAPGKPYGAHRYPTSWRLFFAAPFQGAVSAFGRTWNVTAPARGVLTLRAATASVVPYAKNGDPSDFSGGGAFDVDPWGSDGTITDHDRIMQRCPVERLDLDTGERITTPVKDYNLSAQAACPPYPAPAWPFIEYDGEHRSRAWRLGIRFPRDPAAKQDLLALNEDTKLFWKPYGELILTGPGAQGHGYVGRSWAWAAWLASHVDREFSKFLRRVAEHVIDPRTGSPQRLVQGQFYGSPDPWAAFPGGSGVAPGTPVFQKLEQYHLIGAFRRLGMNDAALKLSDTVLKAPGKKWCDANTGLPVGQHSDDYEQNWIGLGAVAQISPAMALTYATHWPIMRPGGSVAGPYFTKDAILTALRAWGAVGKYRAFEEALL